jgi:Family of unknown function (DUF5522)
MKNLKEKMGDDKSPLLFYIEDGKYVFTEEFHLQRKFCCGNKCRHCPYIPKHIKGNTEHKQ